MKPLAAGMLLAGCAFAAQAQSLTGDWTFRDAERTGGQTWRLHLDAAAGQGRITQAQDAQGKPVAATCTHCKGTQRNAPLQGMTVMQQLVSAPEPNIALRWKGQWFDPMTGRSTDALLMIGADPNTLTLMLCKSIFCKRYALKRVQ